MNRTAILEQIQKNVERLSAPDLPEYKYIPLHQKPSPSVATLHEIMRLLRTVIFPGFFGTEQEAQLGSIQYYTGVYLEKIYDLLQEQIYNGLCFEVERCCDSKDRASEISIAFINRIPHIKYLLSTDVKAILDGRLYQGVTLGAKSFTLDEEGLPIDLPRHPIIEDYVTIYSNASILGRITIGRGSIIGGNIWLTHSVPPNSKISQSRVEEKFTEI